MHSTALNKHVLQTFQVKVDVWFLTIFDTTYHTIFSHRLMQHYTFVTITYYYSNTLW